MRSNDNRRPFGKGGDASSSNQTNSTTNDQRADQNAPVTDSLAVNYPLCQDELATMAAILAEDALQLARRLDSRRWVTIGLLACEVASQIHYAMEADAASGEAVAP
jgi:hypothetical protein